MREKKRFVLLLQRFGLVVQEGEYIRVRGFHIVFLHFNAKVDETLSDLL